MTYFGILKAGATAVPIAHESSVPEIVTSPAPPVPRGW
jgi:hypothetical protein